MSAVQPIPTPLVKPTVVLACASDDATAMAKVLRRLVERGVRVDVVAGVDFDVRPFQEALARGTSRTVYVICRSDDLDAFQVDRLRTAAQNAKVTSDRLVLVPFDPELPIDFAETVLRQLAENGRVVRRVTREVPPPPVVGPRRTTVTDLSVVATGPAARRVTAMLGKPSGTKPAVKTTTPVPTAAPIIAPPVVASGAKPAAAKPMPARIIAAPVVGAPIAPPTLAKASTNAITSAMPTEESFFRLVLDATPANQPRTPMAFDDGLDDEFDDAITSVIALQADSMRVMSGVATPMAGPTSAVDAPAPAPPLPVLVETAVAFVDLQGADPAAATKPDWPQVEMPAAAPVQSEPSTASLSLAEGLGQSFPLARRGANKRLGIALAIAAGVLATIVGVSRSDVAPATTQSWTGKAHPIAVTTRELDAASAATELAAAQGPVVETPAVMAALEARTIRALDGLFVAVAKAPTMRRGAATAHCRDLVIATMTNWRLPTAGEIGLLGEAGFVPQDSTWWLGGKKVRKPRVEWTGKRVRPQSAKKTAAARTVCVHALAL